MLLAMRAVVALAVIAGCDRAAPTPLASRGVKASESWGRLDYGRYEHGGVVIGVQQATAALG
jgi:hypothetical protein